MKKISLLIVVLLFCAFQVYSKTWNKTNFPHGCQISSILVVDDNTILAGTNSEMPGVFATFGVIKSTDCGNTWNFKDNIISKLAVNTLYQTKDGTIWCGINGTDIYKSTDIGETWIRMNTSFSYIENFLELDNGTLLAITSTWTSYKSTDKGISWQKITDKFSNIWGAAKDSKGNVYFIPSDMGVWKSTDNCATVTDISGSSLSDKTCRAIMVDKDDNIWVVSWKSIFFSSNSGNTWVKRFDGMESYSGSPKGSVIKQNQNTGEILLGLHFGQMRKYNQSESKWEIYSNNLQSQKNTSIEFNSKGGVFVGDLSIGIFTSSDNGQNWNIPDLGVGEKMIYEFAEFNNILYIGTGDGIIYQYNSNNDSCKIIQYPNFNPQCFVMALGVTNKGTVLSSRSGAGFYRSSDNGETWMDLYSNSKILPEVFLVDGDIIYAGNRSTAKGVYISNDDGFNWKLDTGIVSTKDIYSLEKNINGDLFAGTGRQGFYKKPTQTGVWEKLSFPDSLFIYGLVSNSKNELFVGVADGGIFKSTNMGLTFTKLDFNGKVLAMTRVTDKNSSSFDDIYIGTDTDCYFYNHKTELFEHIPEGYSGTYSRAIFYHKQMDKIFAGGMKGGLHSLSLSEVSVNDNVNEEIFQISPNPATDFITIVVQNFESLQRIEIYNIFGENVFSVEQSSSTFQKIDISTLRQGVYFLKFGERVSKFIKM